MTPEDWENKFFSNEFKIKLIDSVGRTYVKRRKDELYDRRCVTTTVKFEGGSVIYWGGFSSNGTDSPVQIKGTLDQHKCIDLLEQHLLPICKRKLASKMVLKQDNAPCHKKNVKDFF